VTAAAKTRQFTSQLQIIPKT